MLPTSNSPEVATVDPAVDISPMGSVRGRIARHPVAAFLLMLYPISWILFVPDLLGKSGFGVIPVDIPAQVGILLATTFGLTGVAFLVTRIADGTSGTSALRRSYYQFRAAPQWYLMAVLGAPLLLLIVGLIGRGTNALSAFGSHASQIPTSYLLNVILIAILISVWEEGAWMAFMTARLQRRWGPIVASVAVAPCFGFIHFPLFFVTGGLMDGGRPQGIHVLEYAIYLLVLFSVPLRIVITWAFNSTKGSLPVIALMHASVDTTASGAVLTAFYPGIDGRILYVAIAVVAAIVIALTRGRLGYRNDAEASVPLLAQPTHT
jgi:membrane protease YdiL (CAAX protease family)